MPKRCPICAQEYDGNPRTCPKCGARLPDFDPSRCEFCGTKVRQGLDSCPNCGAPIERPEADFKPMETGGIGADSGTTTITTTVTTAQAKSAGCAVKAVVLVIVIAAALPVLLGVGIPLISHCAHETRMSKATAEERGAVITPAPAPDSIYTAAIVEGENTVETIWPRVITDLPDSVSWVNNYSPAAAFSFSVTEPHSLVQLDASSPNDLVMSLLRVNDDGSMTFLRFNDDSNWSRDPSIVATLTAGNYLAIVNSLSGYEYGDVRFVWQVIQDDIPFLRPDTTFTITLSDRHAQEHFFVNIEADSSYVFGASSPTLDSYVELRTAGGSVLSDDDGGEEGLDARLAFTATALQSGEAELIVSPYRYSSSNRWGDMRVTFIEGTEPTGGRK